ADVFSLATEKSHRVRTGALEFLTYLDPLPQTDAELSTLRHDIKLVRLYDGTLVGADGQSTAIIVGVPNSSDRLETYRDIQNLIAGLRPMPEDIRVTGAPIAESLLGTHILQDL